MGNHRFGKFLMASIAMIGGVCGADGQEAGPARGDRDRTAPRAEGEPVLRGRIVEFLKNKHDDIDGLLLDGQKRVHFPPHIGEGVARQFDVGDRVSVRGREEVRPRGDVVFEASWITGGGRTIEIDHPEPPRGKPRPKAKHEVVTGASGIVEGYATAPHGEVDGLILEGGTVVKLPPHLRSGLRESIRPGDRVRVDGHRHETPRGDSHLHADRVAIIEKAAGPDREAEGTPRPISRDVAKGDPSNEEILKEIRELRRLLEELD